MSAPGSGGYGPQQPYGQQQSYAPQGYDQQQYGPSPYGPPGPAQPPPKKPWALITLAFGCIFALLVGIGGGITYLVLSGGEPTADGESSQETPSTDPGSTDPTTEPPPTSESPTPADPGPFQVISPIAELDMTADELIAVMATSPLTEGTIPAISTCELPETPVDHDVAQLQALLDAAGGCLNQIWADTSSDRGLPWVSPTITVYTWPEIPPSACDADTFEEDYPRTCNLDATIYWPIGYGYGASQPDPAQVPTTYLWDLSLQYMVGVMWHSSLGTYNLALGEALEGDPDRQNEAWRRYALQLNCVSAAVSMRVPEASRPSAELRAALVDNENWTPQEGDRAIQASSRTTWIKRGLDSGGDLSQCNTWTADAEQVA